MTTLKKYFNSKGLTLIEILASIIILGIIITAFFSFFSQSMMFSSKVEDKFSAVNIAERILYEVNNDLSKTDLKQIKQSCTNTPLVPVAGEKIKKLKADSSGDYFYEVNNKRYYPSIIICQTVDEEKLDLYRVHIEIYNDIQENPNLLSELFDYINLR